MAHESTKTKITNEWVKETYTVPVKETTPSTIIEFQSVFVDGFEETVGIEVQLTPESKPTDQVERNLFFCLRNTLSSVNTTKVYA